MWFSLTKPIMKARPIATNNCNRSPRWSALLVLFAVLSLVMPPSNLCALVECTLMESVSGHAHTSDQPHADVAAHAHSHHYGGSHHDAAGHEAHVSHSHHKAVFVSPLPELHACCWDDSAPPVVAVAPSRLSAPDEKPRGLSFLSALLPSTLDVFALTTCHGRDGPASDLPFPRQLPHSPLSGRAPPLV